MKKQPRLKPSTDDARKAELIEKVKVLAVELGRPPLQVEFVVERKLSSRSPIQRLFGGFDGLLKAANIKESNFDQTENTKYIFQEDMKTIRQIMLEFNLDPVPKKGTGEYAPIARTIFCNVLALKYPILLDKSKGSKDKTRDGFTTQKQLLRKFLKCHHSSISHYLRESALLSIKGYKEYENRYKVIKAGFLGDSKYIELQRLQQIRDNAQLEMNRIMKILLEEVTL